MESNIKKLKLDGARIEELKILKELDSIKHEKYKEIKKEKR